MYWLMWIALNAPACSSGTQDTNKGKGPAETIGMQGQQEKREDIRFLHDFKILESNE
jgi:hypothetical protein